MPELHNIIRSLDVPVALMRTREGPPLSFGTDQQALVVGAQMAEFGAQVPQSVHPVISEGLLLGQLAADKAAGDIGDAYLWYQTFGTVMRKIGWLVADLDFQQQSTPDDNAEVSKAIIPVVAAMLGPQAATASIIMAVLKGMDDVQKDTPWITLFMRKSQNFGGAKFRLSYVDAGTSGGAALRTVFFGIEAQPAVAQGLLFKFTAQSATIRNARTEMAQSAAELETSPARFATTSPRSLPRASRKLRSDANHSYESGWTSDRDLEQSLYCGPNARIRIVELRYA